MKLERARTELLCEPVALDEADAVLAGDRAAEAECQLEERLRELRGELELTLVVTGEQERRVEVAVAGVAPRASGDSETAAHLE